MAKKQRKFADDGWAVWIDGEDTSTIHINDWLNPTGKSYVDIAIHIRGIKSSKSLNVYVPFFILDEEIEDVSLLFENTKILQAIFSAACIVDYMKNPHTSEIAYNGKTVDIVHISTTGFKAESVSDGTLIRVDLQDLQPYIDNDEEEEPTGSSEGTAGVVSVKGAPKLETYVDGPNTVSRPTFLSSLVESNTWIEPMDLTEVTNFVNSLFPNEN